MNTIDVTVEVTQEDIEKGNRANCRQCPVARAVSRMLIDNTYVAIERFRYYIDEIVWGKRLPDEAIDFIVAFDTGRPVSPFAFTLAVPEELVKR